MIILKSDYSPESAQELQEVDNIKMMNALLLLGGLPQDQFDSYYTHSAQAAAKYGEALESSDSEDPDVKWEEAKEAARAPMEHAAKILSDNLVRIDNKLVKSDQPGYYSHIETTIHQDGEAVARIERPVVDIEAETYEDNSIGLGA